mmetsp:Transcript_25298/g.60071  ORF Transcript_25298/g.60071 Transcript_25298/m.60071 type:complete len:465 (-) Transcript_25298:94-1488(-)
MRSRIFLGCLLWAAIAQSLPIQKTLQHDEHTLEDEVEVTIRSPRTGSLDHRTVRQSRISRGARHLVRRPPEIARRFEANPAWPSYSNSFQHAWTSFQLESGIVAADGIPSLVQSSRVLVMGDPCTAGNHLSTLVECMEKKLNTTYRIPEILSTLSEHVDAVLLLGDNFYDSTGAVSMRTMAAAQSMDKNKQLPLLMTVPGNHDYWINGKPHLQVPWDQRGWGFLQFYGQDTVALQQADSYNFTKAEHGFPNAANFFWYNTIGSVGYLGFSGAHSWSEQEGMFGDACRFFSAVERNISAVFVAGHWSATSDGECGVELDTPSAHQKMQEACPALAPKLYHVFGHVHCNRAMEDGRGFMVGACGMRNPLCAKDFGFVVIDSANASAVSVDYFQLEGEEEGKRYDDVIACLRKSGPDAYGECQRAFANEWMRHEERGAERGQRGAEAQRGERSAAPSSKASGPGEEI